MSSNKGLIDRVFKFLASLNLAVFNIVGLAVICTVGTIVESRFDARVANVLVYHSIYMRFFLVLLCVNLLAVIIDRFPWKPHHLGFILAHIGIITLMLGAYITERVGLDGSLSIDIGKENQYISLPETDLVVKATLDGNKLTTVFDKEVNFFVDHPKETPLDIPLPDAKMEVVDYYRYALQDQKIVASKDERHGPAVRFQLQNQNVNLTNWVRANKPGQVAERNLGPAKIILAAGDYKYQGGNEIVIRSQSDGSLQYTVYSKREGIEPKTGQLVVGKTVETGWMGLVFRMLKYLPMAKEKNTFIETNNKATRAVQAIKIRFNDEEHWMGLNSLMRFFGENGAYVVYYSNRIYDLRIPIKLVDFEVGRYQGTMRAATYQSEVVTPDGKRTVISMNEPLKYEGLTFYQASFNEDSTGRPIASVLSVNKDPGRWIKYLGSFLIVLGTMVMFYFKSKKRRVVVGHPEDKKAG